MNLRASFKEHRSQIYALLWSVFISALIFTAIYRSARLSVLNEIRQQAMGMALAIAASLPADEVAELKGEPEDSATELFKKLQDQLSAVSRYSRDVYSVYLMTRSRAPEALSSDYVYLIDDMEEDVNQDGVIDESETPMPPGTAYDASDMPSMVLAWDQVAADEQIYPDPPYPDSMSGYAPVKDGEGKTIAIVGVDVTADAISAKLLRLRYTLAAGFMVVALVITASIYFYLNERKLAAERQALIGELREAVGRINTLSGLLPICSSCKKIRNDQGEWERLETYVAERSNAEFSHGICPECAQKLYPDTWSELSEASRSNRTKL